MKPDGIADAIRQTMISSNVCDSNWENANIVDALDSIARGISVGLKFLGNGDAATPMGAIEAHGAVIEKAGERIAQALDNVADAIRELAEKK
jgi:hypothetical protein